MPLPWKSRCDAETSEPYLSARAVHQDVRRLDLLVDEAALMDAAQGRGDADGEAQEASHLHRRAQDPVERIASRILEQQHGPAALAHELQRAHRPGTVQVVLQSVFVSETIQAARRRVFRGGKHRENGVPVALAPSPAEDALAVFAQHLHATIPSAEPRGWVHVPDPAVRRAARHRADREGRIGEVLSSRLLPRYPHSKRVLRPASNRRAAPKWSQVCRTAVQRCRRFDRSVGRMHSGE